MKAAVLSGIRSIDIREFPDPKLSSPTDVLLRVAMVGICGTDFHYYRQGRVGDQAIKYPSLIGHECVAVVEKIGDQVTRVRPNDCVVVDPAVSCGHCDQCKAGRSHTCLNLHFLGFPGQMEGCLCEFIVIPEKNCYLIEGELTLLQGTLVEPLSIGVYGIELLKELEAKTIGILGCGPIGLSVLLVAQIACIQSISVTDKIQERLTIALNNGACWAGNPEELDVVAGIKKQAGELDVVLECCGDQQALDQGVDLLKPGGKLLILGIPDQSRVSFDINKLRRKEISIQNVRRQNRCTQKAIDLIASKKVSVDFMLTHTFPLERTKEAFEIAANYRDGVIKVMITP
ncbi:MAG: alcohol dehydrogenase catalytic domain-containing protein [Candidatus Aminicenantes bacterium]|nr:alcohol dehydrogenase catalytic domain-containing protein [Candidatus Aminicenantes bacterium]